MIADIKARLKETQFTPFTIHMSDGRKLSVPTLDHVKVTPAGGRVLVFHDDDSFDILSGLHISGVKVDKESKVQSSN